MTQKITISGWICETKYSPTDTPLYTFFINEMRTQYTCPIMPYSFEVEIPSDNTAVRVRIFDELLAQEQRNYNEKVASIKAEKQSYLALDCEVTGWVE